MLTLLLSMALQAPQSSQAQSSQAQSSPSPQAPVPTAQNYTQWLAYVEPDATETAYRAIQWRNQFWPAVQEARALGRPILFWTMNGHPLGCT